MLLLLTAATARAQTSPAPGIAVRVDTAAVDTSSVPQRDAMDVLKGLLGKRVEPQFNIEPATGLQWALLPTFSYNPVYGAAFGVLVSGSGRRGSTRARFSNLSVSANVSTTSQVQVQVRGDIFSEDEDFLTKADFRYLDTTRSTWGLGPVDDQAGEYPMSFLLNRLYATVLRRVSGPVYLGLGYHFDQFSSIADQRADQGEATPFTDYSGGYPTKTRATGLSVDLLADTRDNQVNPGAGYLLNWSFRDYFEGMGSDSDWQELWVEARVYPHEPKHGRNVLAFWLYGWFTFGAAPYLNLPSNGWDTYGRGARGYLAGRIRGGDQIYVESEYRWTISRDGLWGAVVFANGTATTTDSGTFGQMDAAVGTGLRIKLNKHTDTNISLDYGWGLEAGHGFFLGLGEVF